MCPAGGGGFGDGGRGLLRSKAVAAPPAMAAAVMPGVLAVLYCAGLFSNSFIEVRYEYLGKLLGTAH